MNKILRVILWGEEIGRLSWDNRRHLSYFTYNPNLVNRNWNISPISAPYNEATMMMPIWGETERIYQKLPAFLADSLPDAWGNQLFEYWRKEQKLSNAEITPLDKLAFIGKRGMGALEFEPELNHGTSFENIEIQSLANLAERIFTERENAIIKADESLTMQSLIAVGTSAGGRQPKALIAINRETGEIRSGQIMGMKGFDYCILKFGYEQYCSAELEMTYYELATMAGINMMPSQLIEVEGKRHFLTQRFDRQGEEKLHIQTLAAIDPEADSYEQLMLVCRKLHLSEREYEEVFRRMVFNHLANNTDDHNKNFSFMMNRLGQWHLAPAYDLTYITDNGGYLPDNNHCIFLRGKLSNINIEDIMAFAQENGIRRAKAIIEKTVIAIQHFRNIATKNHVKEEWIGRIETFLQQKLNSCGYGDYNITSINFIAKNGSNIENAHLEQTYKGNLHLLASIDGKQHKFVITKGNVHYTGLISKGLSNISPDTIIDLVNELLIKNS